MKHWPTKPLAEIATVIRGVSFDKSQVSDEPNKNSIPILRAGNIQDSLLTDLDLVYVPDELVSEEQRLRRGDLAICMSSGSPTIVGKTAHLAVDWRGAVGAFCAVVRFKPQFHHRFGSYWFRSPAFLQWRNSNAKGANIQNLRRTDLEKLSVPLPPLAEQERIVKLLDEADGLRKLRAEADQRTAALIAAIFHEMFGDPKENPFGWPVNCAGELMETCEYGTSQKANEEGRGVVVLRMGNVTRGGELELESLKTVELSQGELAKQRLQDGDVLFNRTNSRELVGKTGMWDGRMEAVAASYFIRVRFRSDIEHPQHFTTFMNLPSMKRRLAEMARGAIGQANINSQELRAIELPVPPIALQREFADRVTEIRAVQADQAASRHHLDRLFQSMLHRAFQGEL